MKHLSKYATFLLAYVLCFGMLSATSVMAAPAENSSQTVAAGITRLGKPAFQLLPATTLAATLGATCSRQNCNGLDPILTRCANGFTIKSSDLIWVKENGRTVIKFRVELLQSVLCRSYWARVYDYDTQTYYAFDAYVYDGSSASHQQSRVFFGNPVQSAGNLSKMWFMPGKSVKACAYIFARNSYDGKNFCTPTVVMN